MPEGSLGAVDAGRRCRKRVQARVRDWAAAGRAGAVPTVVEALLRGVDVGERRSRFVEEGGDLLALPGDRVAFGIVFVIGCHIAGGLDDPSEAVSQTRGAPSRRRAQFVQS